MDQMNEYTPDLYELIDEEGNKQSFELIDCMEFEGETYYALTPYFEDDQGQELLDDSGELVILRVEYDNETGEEILASIDDDELFDRIGEQFLKRIGEIYDFDDEDEDENGEDSDDDE